MLSDSREPPAFQARRAGSDSIAGRNGFSKGLSRRRRESPPQRLSAQGHLGGKEQ